MAHVLYHTLNDVLVEGPYKGMRLGDLIKGYRYNPLMPTLDRHIPGAWDPHYVEELIEMGIFEAGGYAQSMIIRFNDKFDQAFYTQDVLLTDPELYDPQNQYDGEITT